MNRARSGSIIADITISPPLADSVNEGSASRTIELLTESQNSTVDGLHLLAVTFPIPADPSALSNGQIAGIIVGVLLFVLIAAAVAAFALVRWRRRRVKEDEELNFLALSDVTILAAIGECHFDI